MSISLKSDKDKGLLFCLSVRHIYLAKFAPTDLLTVALIVNIREVPSHPTVLLLLIECLVYAS